VPPSAWIIVSPTCESGGAGAAGEAEVAEAEAGISSAAVARAQISAPAPRLASCLLPLLSVLRWYRIVYP
jgi:hypothetical protein